MTSTIGISHINCSENMHSLPFGQRIGYIIEKNGLSKIWVAKKLGISRQALNYLLNHASKPKFVDEFSEILGVSPEWIENGMGNPISTHGKKKDKIAEKLPISDCNDIIVGINNNLSENGYIDFFNENPEDFVAYKLEDDSVFPPFIQGSILIFNVKKQPSNGDYILAIIDNNVVVRQYIVDDKNICYKASNLVDKTFINPLSTIIGVLSEARYQIS